MGRSAKPWRTVSRTEQDLNFTRHLRLERKGSCSRMVMDLLDPGWPSVMDIIQRRELMLEVFGREIDLSQAELTSLQSHVQDQEHSFQGNVCIEVRGCFDSTHTADLKLDIDCFIIEIKQHLQEKANVPIRYQTLLREGDVVPLDDLQTLRQAGFCSEEVVLLIKQKPKRALQELMDLSFDLLPSRVKAEVKFLSGYISAHSLKVPWQVQMLFEVALLGGMARSRQGAALQPNFLMAELLLEGWSVDPNTGVDNVCCGMGCCGPPYMTLLERLAEQGDKAACLFLLDSGRLNMEACMSVDRASKEFDSRQAFERYIKGNRFYHMILREGWDATYPLCHAYVEKADLALAVLDIDDDFAQGHIHYMSRVLSESQQENLQLGNQRKRLPCRRCRLPQNQQERQRRQPMCAELKKSKERRSRSIKISQDRDYKAWFASVNPRV